MAGGLFEDIQKRSRAIESVALRTAHPFYDARTFQSFDGALRGQAGMPNKRLAQSKLVRMVLNKGEALA